MLNFRKIFQIHTSHLKDIFSKQYYKNNHAIVNSYPLILQYHRHLWDKPKSPGQNLPCSSLPQELRRFFHTSNRFGKEIRYRDYIELKDGIVVIDVREPGEIKRMGRVSGSINIPLDQLKKAFSLSQKEWKKKYKTGKPSEDTPIMVICSAGVRSKTGANVLRQMGYDEAMSYRGGYKMFKAKR